MKFFLCVSGKCELFSSVYFRGWLRCVKWKRGVISDLDWQDGCSLLISEPGFS